MANLYSCETSFCSFQPLCAETDDSLSPRSSNIFAVTIGINECSIKSWHFPPLKGAVADANSISEFLSQYLNADRTNIENLRDQQATKSAIVDVLKGLANDRRIQPGNLIIIYFAGHTRGPSKGIFDDEDRISLWAADSSLNDPESGLTGEEIYNLLDLVSKAKGNNIVLILDTCHSACFSPEYIRRTASIERISEEEEEPYILLSACKHLETAKEYEGGGAFTQELLTALRNSASSPNSLTYDTLINNVGKEIRKKHRNQTPRYFGGKLGRTVFDLDVDTRKAKGPLFSVRLREQNEYALDINADQVIEPGAKLAIFQNSFLGNLGIPIGTLQVSAIRGGTADLEHVPDCTPFNVPDEFFARDLNKF